MTNAESAGAKTRTKGASGAANAQLGRLERLQGTDEGIFVLAVHSFMEGRLREIYHIDDESSGVYNEFGYPVTTFAAMLGRFLDDLISRSGGAYIDGFRSLKGLKDQHFDTNRVRHEFAALDSPSVEIATAGLLAFCSLSGIGSPEQLERIRAALSAWDERRTLHELSADNRRLSLLLKEDRTKAEKQLQKLAEYAAKEKKTEETARELEKVRAELAEAVGRADRKNSRVDELRAKQNELLRSLKEAETEKNRYKKEAETIGLLRRMTALTRTRSDYERSILRLMADQEEALEQIKYSRDFLIKGAAGTGKTLVLLKAIERAEEEAEKGKGRKSGSLALLTYTTTLAKYDKYIASLLRHAPEGSSIGTVNSFLADRLRELSSRYSISYDVFSALAKKLPVPGFTEKQLETEIDGFIWANSVDGEGYLSGKLKRQGMEKPLPKKQRALVWEAAEKLKASMLESGMLTRNLASCIISESAVPAGGGNPDLIFIDEAQDLPAVVIRALKSRAKKAVILAGDADQAIYQPGFSFKKAGVDIGGRTRILKNNFRNSVQIHEVAERFRLMGEAETDSRPVAARDGPMPELFEYGAEDDAFKLIQNRLRLFIDGLDYAPENICVAAPLKSEVAKVSAALSEAGYSVSDIHTDDFDFAQKGSVCVSTLNSVKGLDFPVMILYLPRLHGYADNFGAEEGGRIKRNLVYVGMTRAMEQLTVVVPSVTSDEVLIDVKKSFAGQKSE